MIFASIDIGDETVVGAFSDLARGKQLNCIASFCSKCFKIDDSQNLGRTAEVWSMDFVHDRLENGRKLKVLNVVDDFSRVCVGQIVSDSITGKHRADFFETLEVKPKVLRCDNGPEFW